ncbi:MAG: hypothetical protein H6828_03060 [Planctomycetes bacterium]|nr:hypothetical protein [Planctomycetota bacterium]
MRSPRRSRAALAAALIALLPLAACRTSSGGRAPAAYPPVVPADFGTMNNVSAAGPIWIGGMPTAEDLELAQRRGIEKVVDLSVPSEPRTCDIASECRLLGLEYASAGLEAEGLLTDASVDLVLQALDGDALPPTLMFCGTGGRSATYLAIYRVVQLGVPLEEALVEARRAGMPPGKAEEFVRREVARLEALAAADRAVTAQADTPR